MNRFRISKNIFYLKFILKLKIINVLSKGSSGLAMNKVFKRRKYLNINFKFEIIEKKLNANLEE